MPLLLPIDYSSAHKLIDAGCEIKPAPVLIGLMKLTNNDPCKTGCAYFHDGACLAYRKYHSDFAAKPTTTAKVDESVGGKWVGMTTAQIMAKENISKGEFRKRKIAGAYRE